MFKQIIMLKLHNVKQKMVLLWNLVLYGYHKCMKCVKNLLTQFKLRYIVHLIVTDIVIGFVPDVYTVTEGGMVNFNVTVISRTLTRNIVVEFFTSYGDATGSIIGTFYLI